MNLWQYIREKMMEYPEQMLCEGNASITYKELCEMVEKNTKELKGDSYAILCKSELIAAIALLSCVAADKPVVPLPTRYGPEVYQKILERSKVSSVITDIGGNVSEYPTGNSIKTDAFFNTAVILFTSGSTGEPKGVRLSHDNLISNIKDICVYFDINREDTILISRPIYHSSVLTGEFLVSLCKGTKIVFLSESFNPSSILSALNENSVTVLGSTPTLMTLLSNFIRCDAGISVRKLSISGECITDGMAKKIRKAFPNADIYCGYGLSEASPRVAFLPPNLFDINPTCAGVPLQSVSIRIVNEKGEDVLKDDVGELIVRGPNVMQGYFDDKDKSDSVLRNGYLHTGDLACFDAYGLLYIKGRKDDMMICAGMNIYPAEIENALSTDKRISSVVASGYLQNGMQKISLEVCGDFSGREEIVELCKEKLPKYQMPSKITFSNEPSVRCGGKIRRR